MTELKLKKFAQAAAYFALIFVAIALILTQIAGSGSVLSDIADVLYRIANALAYILIAISAFFYAKTKRNIVYMITYIVAVVLLVIFMILPLF